MPDTPWSRDVQNSSALLPMGVTAPNPVTTTRRLSTLCASSLLVFLDVVDGVSDGRDLLGVLVGDLEIELLLERHHQLDGVERIGPAVVDHLGIGMDFVLLHPELLADDLLDPLLHWLGHEHLLLTIEWDLGRARAAGGRPSPTCKDRR